MISPKYHISHAKGEGNAIEIYLDYNCPFSGKMFRKLQDELMPLVDAQGLTDKYQFIFVNVVQPWHGFQSSILHDASLAVAKVKPDSFWDASRALFDHIEEYYDSEVYDLTKRQLVEKISGLLADTCDIEKSQLISLIEPSASIDGKPNNAGNAVAKDCKYFARYSRTMGIHMTPSVVVNGIYIPQIESSTPVEQILEIMEAQTS
ncbi:hypothetical protein DAMA08_021900 [Martiniozyma asiatica (nom. inval.)]|nr:hypothetical protein DAMA08_021900 [Martiniozyma asiatica]